MTRSDWNRVRGCLPLICGRQIYTITTLVCRRQCVYFFVLFVMLTPCGVKKKPNKITRSWRKWRCQAERSHGMAPSRFDVCIREFKAHLLWPFACVFAIYSRVGQLYPCILTTTIRPFVGHSKTVIIIYLFVFLFFVFWSPCVSRPRKTDMLAASRRI